MVCGDTASQQRLCSIATGLPRRITPAVRLKMNQNRDHFESRLFRNSYRSSVSIRRHRSAAAAGQPCVKLAFANVIFALFACACFLSVYAAAAAEDRGDFSTAEARKGDAKSGAVSGCPQCRISRETLENLTLEAIKNTILAKLGFTNGTPNASHLGKPMPLVTQLFSFNHNNHVRHDAWQRNGGAPIIMQNDEAVKTDDDDDGRIKTHSLFAKAKEYNPKPAGMKLSPYPYSQPMLQFSFDQKSSRDSVVNARLWVYQKKSSLGHHSHSRTVKVQVYRAKTNPSILKTIEINLTAENKWIEIDLKDPLVKHFNENDITQIYLSIDAEFACRNETSDMPLVTNCKKCDQSDKSKSNYEEDCVNVPYLELQTEEPKSRRKKRSAPMDCNNDTEISCCRRPLMVDFELFKWDFIIAPKRFNAYYCAGECTYMSPQHPHTHLMKMTPGSLTPCCGSRKMGSINMLYFNPTGNIIYGVVPNMVVERCGCQ